MPPEVRVELVELKPEERSAGKPPAKAMQAEGERLIAALPSAATVLALELVKERAYDQADAGQASAALALRIALSTLLRLLAPVIAFATEEAWSWFEDGSVHTAAWPEPRDGWGDERVLAAASTALIGIRRAKTEAKASQKTPVRRLSLTADPVTADLLRLAEGDLKAVGRISSLEISTDEQRSAGLSVDAVELESEV